MRIVKLKEQDLYLELLINEDWLAKNINSSILSIREFNLYSGLNRDSRYCVPLLDIVAIYNNVPTKKTDNKEKVKRVIIDLLRKALAQYKLGILTKREYLDIEL